MKNYAIMSSTNPIFPVGMEIPLPIDDIKIGDEVQFLTDLCICTQDIGAIMLNRAGDGDTDLGAVYTLMEVPNKAPINPYPRRVTIDTVFEDLQINKEIDIFFETKEIMISPTDHITRGHGITVEALFKFLEKEWVMAGSLLKVPFPLLLEENNNLVFWDYWQLSRGSEKFLIEGSWNRKVAQKDGRISIIEDYTPIK